MHGLQCSVLFVELNLVTNSYLAGVYVTITKYKTQYRLNLARESFP